MSNNQTCTLHVHISNNQPCALQQAINKQTNKQYLNWQKSSVLEPMQVLDWCVPEEDFRVWTVSAVSSMLTILIRDQSPDLLQAQRTAFSVTSPSLMHLYRCWPLQFPWGWSSDVEECRSSYPVRSSLMSQWKLAGTITILEGSLLSRAVLFLHLYFW